MIVLDLSKVSILNRSHGYLKYLTRSDINLTKPQNVFNSLVSWLDFLDRAVQNCRHDGSDAKKEKDRCNLLMIVGNKYDIFQNEER